MAAAIEERSGMDGLGLDWIGSWGLGCVWEGELTCFNLLKSLCAANVFSVEAWLAL
jgi:hypothetical protein